MVDVGQIRVVQELGTGEVPHDDRSAVPRDSTQRNKCTRPIDEVLSARFVSASQHEHNQYLPLVKGNVGELALARDCVPTERNDADASIASPLYSPVTVSQ